MTAHDKHTSLSALSSLPDGLFDLLPPHAERRHRMISRFVERSSQANYLLTQTPLFERSTEQDLRNDSRSLSFVDPEDGSFVSLRSDFTPQIARQVTTSLRREPLPLRLSYAGDVVRRSNDRSRPHRQTFQVGAELVGDGSTQADCEVLVLAYEALQSVGYPIEPESLRFELSFVPFAQRVVQGLPTSLQAPVTLALKQRNRRIVESLLDSPETPVDAEWKEALAFMFDTGAQMNPASLLSALRGFRDEKLKAIGLRLEGILQELEKRIVGLRSPTVDLAEVRGLSYYTGFSFSMHDDSVGEALLAGGRYDQLIRRDDTWIPAAGFAIDLVLVEQVLANRENKAKASALSSIAPTRRAT